MHLTIFKNLKFCVKLNFLLFSSLDKMSKRFREKFRRYAKLKLDNHMLGCSYMYQY